MTNLEPISQLSLPDDDCPLLLVSPNGNVSRTHQVSDIAVFPGSFNPLHSGHLNLKLAAEKRLGIEVLFELSIANVEKSALSVRDLQLRLQQFGGLPVAVSNAPRFVSKSQLFRRCHFGVGYDTAVRIVDPQFYNNDPVAMNEALVSLQSSGHTFMVGGRVIKIAGRLQFRGAEHLEIPEHIRPMFVGLTEDEFREDVSSTQIRNAGVNAE